MSQSNQQLGKLTGLVVPKSWKARYTCTVIAVTYGLTAQPSRLAGLKKDLAMPDKVYLGGGSELADKRLKHKAQRELRFLLGTTNGALVTTAPWWRSVSSVKNGLLLPWSVWPLWPLLPLFKQACCAGCKRTPFPMQLER